MILRCIHPKLPLWGKSRSGWGLGLGGCFFHPLTRRHTRYLFEGGEEVRTGGKSGLLPHAVDGKAGVAFFVHQFLGVLYPEFVFQVGEAFVHNIFQAILHMMTGCIQLGTQVVYGERGIEIRLFVCQVLQYSFGQLYVIIFVRCRLDACILTWFLWLTSRFPDGYRYLIGHLNAFSGIQNLRIKHQINRNTQVNG